MNLEKNREEFIASLSLRHTKGLGYRRCKLLVEYYGSAKKAVINVNRWDNDLSIPKEVVNNFLKGSWKDSAKKELSKVSSLNLKVLLYTDPSYPVLLKEIADPPSYFYYIGNIELLKNPCIAVIGSRICSQYGKEIAYNISKHISALGISVVSGFAVGIDREAHIGGLQSEGKSIAVLGCGLDVIYPARNKDIWERLKREGLIITEFPPGTPPEAKNFPKRNRIISGISLGVLVVEAKKRSGSLITARFAMEQGRLVFAVPGSITSAYQGTNFLIRQGATLVTSVSDILEEIPYLIKDVRRSDMAKQNGHVFRAIEKELSDEEREVYLFIKENNKIHIDDLAKKMGWASCKASEILLLLELKGIVVQFPGMYYSLKSDYIV